MPFAFTLSRILDARNWILFFSCAAALLFFNYGGYWSSHWYSKWTVLTLIFVVSYSVWFARKTSYWLLPISLCVGLSFVYMATWNFNVYLKTTALPVFITLGKNAFYTYFAFLMGAFVLTGLPITLKKQVLWFLGLLGPASAIYTIAQLGDAPYHRAAFSGNASMNACLIAALFPITAQLLWRRKYLVLIAATLSLTALFLTKTSAGLGVFGVSLAGFMVSKFKISKRSILTLLVVAAVLFGVGALLLGMKDLFDTSHRFTAWAYFMRWWWEHCPHWFGAGVGSTQVLLPTIQSSSSFVYTGYFLWFHNEWIQSVFEMGYLGGLSVLLATGFFGIRAFKRPEIFGSLMGFYAMGAINYPLRLPIHAAALCLILWLILKPLEKS